MLVVSVQMEVVETITSQPLLRVARTATVQIPGQQLLRGHGDLFARTIERMADDARDEAVEQARQLVGENP